MDKPMTRPWIVNDWVDMDECARAGFRETVPDTAGKYGHDDSVPVVTDDGWRWVRPAGVVGTEKE